MYVCPTCPGLVRTYVVMTCMRALARRLGAGKIRQNNVHEEGSFSVKFTLFDGQSVLLPHVVASFACTCISVIVAYMEMYGASTHTQ